MTRGQQITLVVLIIMLLGVAALLAATLLQGKTTTQAAPTLAALPPPPSLPSLPTWTPVAFRTAPPVEPTWTSKPTRTPPATSTPKPTRTATLLPTITRTFAPTYTPQPTITPTVRPTQTVPSELINPGFTGVTADNIPGWDWWAEDNFEAGGTYNPNSSFDTPLFKLADDPVRVINGPTLQIDAVQHLKFNVHVFQTVPVSPTTRVGFEITAGAFSGSGIIQLAAGIDPDGGPDCSKAKWSDIVALNQDQGVQRIIAPRVAAGPGGQVTVCLYAEPLYAAVSNAAFFDDAELIVNP